VRGRRAALFEGAACTAHGVSRAVFAYYDF
jgi:hypothetical protein